MIEVVRKHIEAEKQKTLLIYLEHRTITEEFVDHRKQAILFLYEYILHNFVINSIFTLFNNPKKQAKISVALINDVVHCTVHDIYMYHEIPNENVIYTVRCTVQNVKNKF